MPEQRVVRERVTLDEVRIVEEVAEAWLLLDAKRLVDVKRRKQLEECELGRDVEGDTRQLLDDREDAFLAAPDLVEVGNRRRRLCRPKITSRPPTSAQAAIQP